MLGRIINDVKYDSANMSLLFTEGKKKTIAQRCFETNQGQMSWLYTEIALSYQEKV